MAGQFRLRSRQSPVSLTDRKANFEEDTMYAARLSWAGVRVEMKGRRFLIDPLQNTLPLKGLLGDPLWPPVAIHDWDGAMATDALVTHRHPDHYDPATLSRALGPAGRVFCPPEIVPELESAGLNARGVAVWETVHPPGLDAVTITAVPAVDWRGEYQVSWVVADGEHCVFHGGDTIWHGSWWRIVERFGGFDIAFLPVNGVIARLSGMAPSNLPATLTPDQAAVAARLLNARIFCPIHYGQFNNPNTYRQHPNIEPAIREAAKREGVRLIAAPDGEALGFE